MERALKKRFQEDQRVSKRTSGIKRVQTISIRRPNMREISLGNLPPRVDKKAENIRGAARSGAARPVIRQGSSKSIAKRNFQLKNKSELWFAGCLFMILLTKLFIRVSIIEASYKIETVRNDLRVEDAKLRELKVKMAMVASPRELSQMASQKLGMRPTLPQQIRRVKFNS